MRARALTILPLAILLSGTLVRAQSPAVNNTERTALHQSPEWLVIAPHLPDATTASAADLEMAGDVLRARRFPEDALDYYGYALTRGGQPATLTNKMGVVHMELQQYDAAKQLFQRVISQDRKNSDAWNNLGAVEFVNKHYQASIADYRRATSLKKTAAVYRANLGLAYFEISSFEDAHQQFVLAMKLDPDVLSNRDSGGDVAKILSPSDYPRLCFEMAKLYAMRGQASDVRLWLAKANEAGFDLAEGLRSDAVLVTYLKDPEVRLMLSHSSQTKKRNMASEKAVPALGTGSKLDEQKVY